MKEQENKKESRCNCIKINQEMKRLEKKEQNKKL
jgi:hypothetical protein